MNKTEFTEALRRALGKLPSYEVEQSIAFYAEMIDDRMEDGMTEAEAVAALGPVEAIAAQIIAETPPIPKAIARANTGSRTLNIVLLAVFSPLWVPIVLALALAVFAVYLSIWAVVVALWAVVVTLLLCAPVGIWGLVYCLSTGFPLTGLWLLGCGLAGAGLGLFAWFGVLAASKGLVQLTHTFACWIKSLFVKRRNKGEGVGAAGAPGVPATGGYAPVPPTPPAPTGYNGVAAGSAACPPPSPYPYPPTSPLPTAPLSGQPNSEGAPSHDHRA